MSRNGGGGGGGGEEWRANADTTKMRPEDMKAYGVEASKRPPGQDPGGVLHQRRSLPFRPATMAVAGFLVVGAIGCVVLYYKSKPDTDPKAVAKAVAGVGAEEGRSLQSTNQARK